MSTQQSILVELEPRIDADNQLIVSVKDAEPRVGLRSSMGLGYLLPAPFEAGAVTVEVRDFFQFGTLYDVYAATLEPDGLAVAAHWEPTGRGRRAAFEVASQDEARKVRFVVGATPRRSEAPVPAVFVSFQTPGGSFPVSTDPKKTNR